MEDRRQPDEEAPAATKAERSHRVEQALRSRELDTVLEGSVAKAVEDDVVDCNSKVGLDGSRGAVDGETPKAIMEVTTRRAGKSKQMRKLLADPAMNPAQKPVIFLAPHYGAHAHPGHGGYRRSHRGRTP